MENKIISINISPETDEEINENAGVMWEHNATSLVFNIDSAYVDDYRYYIEYRSLIGKLVRTEYLELNTATNTITYDIPITMTSLRGVECYFNIVKIDEDGQTIQIIKPKRFYLQFDYAPDTDNSLEKEYDFTINALLEAIRLGVFQGGSGGVTVVDSKMSDTSSNPVQNKIAKQYVDTAVANAQKYIDSKESSIYQNLNKTLPQTFVSKENGKGLSSNDFTDEYKAMLDNAETDLTLKVTDVQESTEDSGSNIVTFSDGSTVTIKNGSKGSKGDKGDTPIKGTDYFTESDKKEMVESIVAGMDNGVPDYWQSALDNGANAIRQAMESVGRNKSAFLFYTDAHWNYGSKMSPTLLKYLYRNTAMTKTFFGGDIVNNESSDREAMKYLYEWREMLKGLPNHHSVVGNHDDGNTTNNLFSSNYIYAYLLAPEETPNMVLGDGMYYYIDEPCEKTRYLFLDTAYKGVDTSQTEFVSEALKSTPNDWHIVAVSHIWYDTIYNGANREVGNVNSSASSLLSMFDNYNSRTGDYADCGGRVEFCIGGHTHLDADRTSATGIPVIMVATDSQHTGGVDFTYGTTTESSVNGIIADYEKHKIYVVRIGRGESREVAVTNYVINYTNLLTVANIGYQVDREVSTTSGEERDSSAGFDLTGYIPLADGDIIRLKNVVMPDGVTDRNNMAYWYDNGKVYRGSFCLTTSHEYGMDWKPVFTDGNLTQFTVPSGYTGMYIRLNATQINETSVITINEVIE